MNRNRTRTALVALAVAGVAAAGAAPAATAAPTTTAPAVTTVVAAKPAAARKWRTVHVYKKCSNRASAKTQACWYKSGLYPGLAFAKIHAGRHDVGFRTPRGAVTKNHPLVIRYTLMDMGFAYGVAIVKHRGQRNLHNGAGRSYVGVP